MISISGGPFLSGFKYSDDSDELCRYLKPFELSPSYINLHCSFGYACQKRCNIHYIDFGVLLYATGNSVQLVDLFSGAQGASHTDHRAKTVLLGHGRESCSGIGAIAVHPSKQFFAVAEKGPTPNIYIYNYPACEVVRILSKGTERAYADVQFSHTGSKLVSVGSDPDFLLTVWDWARERVILRTKAFSQEVFRVAFSPVNEGRLLTSGTGHIRFWKMASTFTGLKLQGSIGKFGQVELSDISSFVELPDGKVLSGTESGNLLMWDGNFIQYTVQRAGPSGTKADRTPCHQGMVEFIALEENNGVREIVTAGADGYIRRWRFDRLEFAEASEEDPVIALTPSSEVLVHPGVQIRHMIRGDDHWVIQDYAGGLWKFFPADNRALKILDCHAGKINAAEAAPVSGNYTAVTAGQDGTVRAWDVLGGEQMYSRGFNAPVTSLLWAPASSDRECRTIIAGFGDGVLRVLRRFKDSFKLVTVLKPASTALVGLALSPDGGCIATASEGGEIFFLSVATKSKCASMTPLGFVKLAAGAGAARSMNWSPDSTRLILASGPDVLEFPRPRDEEYLDPSKTQARESFDITSSLVPRRFRLVVRDTRPVDTTEDDDLAEAQAARLIADGAVLGGPEIDEKGNLRHREPPKPKPVLGVDLVYDISSVLYSPLTGAQSFFLTLDGGGNREDPNYFPGQKVETLYECAFVGEEGQNGTSVAGALPYAGEALRSVYLGRHLGTVHTMRLSQSGKYLLLGTRNGGAQLRSLNDLAYFFYTHYHDGSGGLVAGAVMAQATAAGGNAASNASSAARSNITDRLGVVSGVTTSSDDTFLLSVGHDGNFFAHRIDPASALAHVDRSIELAISSERRANEEARVALQRKKDDYLDMLRKDEEDRLAREAAASSRKDAKTREQKDREAREAKEKEIRDRDMRERMIRDRDARIKAREASKGDKERDDENFDHLATRVPGKNDTKLPLPDASATAVENLEPRAAASASSSSAADADAPDITDPRHYSIEQSKLKAEEDDRLLLAEQKKNGLRGEIADLRAEFLQLLKANINLPQSFRLARDQFELDPQLRLEIEAESQARIEEVRSELAWISEKHSLALQKLRARFLDGLVVEHMNLRSFNSTISVSSFRTPELPPFLRQSIEHVHRMMESEENLRTQQEQQLALTSHQAGASATGVHQHASSLLGASIGAAGTTFGATGTEEKESIARGSGLRGALNSRMASTLQPGGVRNRPPGMSEAQQRKQARAERAVALARLKATK
jgi:WD40 repeat protein